MIDAEVSFVRYVFVDVVGFTKNRSVEAQAEIVAIMNKIVRESTVKIQNDELIYLPTGDGMCVAIIGRSSYDSHIRVAINILQLIELHNRETQDSMRQFKVRIGLNENSDNIVEDINGRRNVAGSGINMAARIMNLADADQILVSNTVHDGLSSRERYLDCFVKFEAKIQHGYTIQVFQYVDKGEPVICKKTPSAFRKEEGIKSPLTEFDAYYVGYGIVLKELFRKYETQSQLEYSATILLWFLAADAVETDKQTHFSPHQPRVYGAGLKTEEEALNYYLSLEFWTACEFAHKISASLWHLYSLFEWDGSFPICYAPSIDSKDRIILEQPKIALKLGFINQEERKDSTVMSDQEMQ